MKSRILKSATWVGLLLVAGMMAAFTNVSLNGSTVELQSAIASGKIVASAKMVGLYSEKSVQLDLTNKSSATLTINIPSGTVFHPEDKGEQSLVTTEDELIVLQPRSQNSVPLDAYCTEASDRCPAAGGACAIGTVTDPKLRKLLDRLKKGGISKSIHQDAVWAVTDGHSIANMDHRSPADQLLRTFVAELTGQKDVWYTTPQQRRVDDSGKIVSETVTIRGNIAYTASKGAMIHNEVVRLDGGSIHRTQAKSAPFSGKVEFTFTLRVKGWEKGQFAVKVMEGERLIAEYPFSI
jgi:hypothetical protein